MGLFSKLKTGAKLATIPFSKEPGQQLQKYFQRMIGMKIAPQRGDTELLKAYSTSPNLRAVVDKVAYNVASTQWKIYKKVDDNGKAIKDKSVTRANFKDRQEVIKQANQSGEMEEITDHPLLDALNAPNEYMTGLQSMKITDIWLDLLGDAFWIKERNGAGMPIEFYPIPRIWVVDSPYTSGSDYYKVSMPNGSTFDIPPSEIVSFIDPDPANPYSGFGSGFGRSLADEIDTDEFAAKHIKNFFHNDARPEILVTGKGIDKSQAKRLKEKWQEDLQGFKNAYLPHFMGGEGVNVDQIGRSFKDMELVELRKHERDIVKSVYGVPPEALGIVENSNRATIEAAKTIMAEFVTIPRLELIRSTLQARLIPDYDDRIILDYVSPLPEDKEARKELMKEHEWVFTKNEIRNAAGLNSVDDGDDFGNRPDNTPNFAPKGRKVVKKKDITYLKKKLLDDYIKETNADLEEIKAIEERLYTDDYTVRQAKMWFDVQKKSVEIERNFKDVFIPLFEEQESKVVDELEKVMSNKRYNKDIGEDEAESLANEIVLNQQEEQTKWVQETLPFFSETVREVAMDTIESIGISFDITNPELEGFANEKVIKFASEVNETTIKQLREQLKEGLLDGESIPELRSRVQEVFTNATNARAELIARTETTGMVNGASNKSYQLAFDSGIDIEKEWITSIDGRERSWHREANGQVVAVKDKFNVDGEKLDSPGVGGSARNVCNCRCAVAPVIGGD